MNNFFYFNRSQKIGSVTLCVLIILSIAIYTLLPYVIENPEQEKAELEKFKQEVLLFEQELEKLKAEEKSNKEKYWKEKFQNQYPGYKKKKSNTKTDTKTHAKINYKLFSFNPNIADSIDFINLGISSNITRNILKYRAAGGKFRTIEQFSKIYGITPEKFNELKPYIDIPIVKKDTSKVMFNPKYTAKKDTILELNTADTTQLKLIRGIGSVYAKSIVYYRKKLGGYYHIEQLKEVPYLRPEAYEAIKNSFTIDTTFIRKIMVNIASVDYMESHPYLNFYQAKDIYELRHRKFQLENISQLYELEELDSVTIERIRPYLSFEKRKKRKRW